MYESRCVRIERGTGRNYSDGRAKAHSGKLFKNQKNSARNDIERAPQQDAYNLQKKKRLRLQDICPGRVGRTVRA